MSGCMLMDSTDGSLHWVKFKVTQKSWTYLVCYYNYLTFQHYHGGRDSAAGVATRYGLDGPGIESLWEQDFPHTSGPALGPTSPPYNGYIFSYPGVKRPDRSNDHPPPSSTEVEERIELHLYSPCAHSTACSRVNFTSPLPSYPP
jgi:hypothetical protein